MGLFSRSKQEGTLMPPPPPFPAVGEHDQQQGVHPMDDPLAPTPSLDLPQEAPMQKPKEILDAEKEIENAIGTIQQPPEKKPGFLKQLFAPRKRGPEQSPAPMPEPLSQPMPEDMSAPIGQPMMEQPPQMDDPLPPQPAQGDVVDAIHAQIDQARKELMMFKLEDAKKRYVEVMQQYNGLAPEDQGQVYEAIKDLYEERKSAERLKLA